MRFAPKSLPGEPGLAVAPRRARDVVIIDDDADHLAMLTSALEHAGWSVRAYCDPEQAALAIAARAPDVVLTDLSMMPIGGVDLAQAIRLDDHLRDVPVVALTGVVEPELRVVRWFDAYLRKPVDLDQLSDLLGALADRGASPRAMA